MRFDRAVEQGRRDPETFEGGIRAGSRIEPDATQTVGGRSPAIGGACFVLQLLSVA